MFSLDTAILRPELLAIYGIGPETADDILVYAANKPSFVIDAYTIRIMGRVGQRPAGRAGYDAWQAMFHDAVPADPQLHNEYHALLDRHHKEACAKNNPRCGECCLRDICEFAKSTQGMPEVVAENQGHRV